MGKNLFNHPMSELPVIQVAAYVHFLVVSIAVLVLVWLLKFREGFAFTSPIKPKIFNLHPLLMVLGFIVFSGEAIITYKAIPARRQVLKLIHIIFHSIALAAGILGVYLVFKFHNELDIPHLYTLHSWIGMGTICLFGVQLLVGFFAFLFPGAEPAARARFAPWHVFLGVVVFFMAIVTAETGLIEKFFFLRLQRGPEALVINLLGLSLLLLGVSVGLAVVLPPRRAT